MSTGTEPPAPTGPPERPLSPGQALAKLFMDNADHGRNAANDELIAALLQRARQIQHSPTRPHHPAPTQH
ncbi:MAG: hypothetical protein ACRDTA_24310 [Pseudonocardiaceae bacterium]